MGVGSEIEPNTSLLQGSDYSGMVVEVEIEPIASPLQDSGY